jgi:arylsulfatase A-like enzyme
MKKQLGFYIYGFLGIGIIAAGLLVACSSSNKAEDISKPNFIIIFTDDQGYNDLGCFGSETIKTPRIDKMASEGLKMTSFYAQPVCGPSRGALLTGRYPMRIGGGWLTNSDEITIAEVMKDAGYATACVGKWDISQRIYQDGLVPNDQGFDYYFGTLGANDRGETVIYRNRDSLYRTDDMSILTKMYTDEALEQIKQMKDEPFFLYLAHSMPHVRIDASLQFKGTSQGELYGDVIEEIDWNVGRIFDLLDELGLDKNTFVVLLSDNGAWSNREKIYRRTHGGLLATGSSLPLRSAKGSPYEGGVRVPCIFWAPEWIPAGNVSNEMMSTLDILPTFARLADGEVPDDRIMDGFDQGDLILGKTEVGARDIFYYHVKGELQAVRKGKWKLVLPDPVLGYFYVKDPERSTPELYDLEGDLSEQHDVANEFPDVLNELLKLAKEGPNDPSDTGP